MDKEGFMEIDGDYIRKDSITRVGKLNKHTYNSKGLPFAPINMEYQFIVYTSDGNLTISSDATRVQFWTFKAKDEIAAKKLLTDLTKKRDNILKKLLLKE